MAARRHSRVSHPAARCRPPWSAVHPSPASPVCAHAVSFRSDPGIVIPGTLRAPGCATLGRAFETTDVQLMYTVLIRLSHPLTIDAADEPALNVLPGYGPELSDPS